MAETQDFVAFLAAQESVFEAALGEFRAGAKRSYWLRFVFPHIAGLGTSAMARRFALSGGGEARDYTAHPVLGDRLNQATGAILAWAGKRSAKAILGPIDAMKLCSSMTLFEAACPNVAIFAATLDGFYGGKRDALTLAKL